MLLWCKGEYSDCSVTEVNEGIVQYTNNNNIIEAENRRTTRFYIIISNVTASLQ